MSAVECEALAVALEALLPNGGSPSEVAAALLPLLAQVKATARAEALRDAVEQFAITIPDAHTAALRALRGAKVGAEIAYPIWVWVS